MNAQLYAEAVRVNDTLISAYKKIGNNMPSRVVANVGNSLLQLGAEMRALLDKHCAATPERCAHLDNVKDATSRAETAAIGGKKQEAWTALMGTHGSINNVMVDVMTKKG